METEEADANLVVFPPTLERTNFKQRDGPPQERARSTPSPPSSPRLAPMANAGS